MTEKETHVNFQQVLDENIGQDKRLGVTKVPLVDLEPETPKEVELRLLPALDMLKIKDKKDRGTITLKVVKENQVLHKKTDVIDEETATLADLNIFPGDLLWVMDSEIHENRNIADELSDPRMEVQRTEEGFRGTLLTSNCSSQVV